MRAAPRTAVKASLIALGILLLSMLVSFLLARHAADGFVRSRGGPVGFSRSGMLVVSWDTQIRPGWVFFYHFDVPGISNGPYYVYVSFFGHVREAPGWRPGGAKGRQ